jgi:hypothetical protein
VFAIPARPAATRSAYGAIAGVSSTTNSRSTRRSALKLTDAFIDTCVPQLPSEQGVPIAPPHPAASAASAHNHPPVRRAVIIRKRSEA